MRKLGICLGVIGVLGVASVSHADTYTVTGDRKFVKMTHGSFSRMPAQTSSAEARARLSDQAISNASIPNPDLSAAVPDNTANRDERLSSSTRSLRTAKSPTQDNRMSNTTASHATPPESRLADSRLSSASRSLYSNVVPSDPRLSSASRSLESSQ